VASAGEQSKGREEEPQPRQCGRSVLPCDGSRSWDGDIWVPCLDPRHGIVARRVKPGLCGLAHGIPAGVRRQALSAFGNSIVPQVAAAVIRAMVKEREA